MLDRKVKGLREVERALENKRRKGEELSGKREVGISELLTASFLRRHTRFSSVDELFEGSGFVVACQEDFDRIPEDKWNAFITKETKFGGWKEMLEAAAAKWVERSLRG